MNSIMVFGRFTKDPIRKKSEDDSFDFISFSLAEKQEYTKKDDKGAVNFYECSVDAKRNPKLGEIIMKYARKGNAAVVKGRMRMRCYTKDGVDRKLWEIIVDGFEFAGGGKQDEQDGQNGDRNAPKSLSRIDVSPDDMPF